MLEATRAEPIRTIRGTCAALSLLMFLSATASPVRSQNSPTMRKVVYKVAPKYPPELKQNDIGGVVRLGISINANGSVAKVTPIGGNPILVDAATVAVKQWKYLPADHPTNTEVQLDFIPRK